jgi:hypothetical protein
MLLLLVLASNVTAEGSSEARASTTTAHGRRASAEYNSRNATATRVSIGAV